MKRSILPLILTMLAPLSCSDAAAPSPLMQALGDEVKQQEIAGGIAVVGSADGIIEMAVGGYADVATKRTMEQNDMFWIASMTKPITACAIMKLREQGKLQLHDPVAKYLPEFQALRDAQGNTATVTIGQCLSPCCQSASAGSRPGGTAGA